MGKSSGDVDNRDRGFLSGTSRTQRLLMAGFFILFAVDVSRLCIWAFGPNARSPYEIQILEEADRAMDAWSKVSDGERREWSPRFSISADTEKALDLKVRYLQCVRSNSWTVNSKYQVRDELDNSLKNQWIATMVYVHPEAEISAMKTAVEGVCRDSTKHY